MIKLPSEELNKLIDRVITKHQWTQSRLAQELNIGPETISRWRSGSGIHRGHYDELLQLAQDNDAITVPIAKSQGIPFSVTIPRGSLRISLDKNGDINIKGLIVALLDKEA